MGSLKSGKDGISEVQGDFYLATAADIVADPSAPDAFVAGIMEGAEWIYNASTNSWIMEHIKNNIEKEVRTKTGLTAGKQVQMFDEFIRSL